MLLFKRKGSVKISYAGDFGVAPQVFQIIAHTCLRHEDMHPYVAIVHYYPVAAFFAVYAVGLHVSVLAHIFFHAFGYRGGMCGGIAFGYDECTGGGVVDIAQVYNAYTVTLTVLNSFYDEFFDVF